MVVAHGAARASCSARPQAFLVSVFGRTAPSVTSRWHLFTGVRRPLLRGGIRVVTAVFLAKGYSGTGA